MAPKKLSQFNKKTRVKINTVRRAMANPQGKGGLAKKSTKILGGPRGNSIKKKAARFGAMSNTPQGGVGHSAKRKKK
jgi:hypothetical protein